MPKKKIKAGRQGVEVAKKQAKVSHALLVVDNAPLLKGHRARYQKVLKDVAKAEEDLLRHQSKDGPEFDRWYNSTFGTQLTAIRTGEEEIHRSARILIDVDEMIMRDGCQDYIAYHRIKLREQGLPDPFEEKFNKKKAKRREQEEEASYKDFETDDDPMDDVMNDVIAEMLKQQAKAYKKAHGTMPPGYDEIMRGLGQKTATPPPPSNHKHIYRQIVTRLHPDRAAKFSPIEQTLWHEAQNAYRSGDTAALEVILARCEAAQDGVEITRASLIVGMIAQARANLSQLRNRLRDFKHHPSWNFMAQKDRGTLKRKIQRNFELELEDQAWRLKSVRMDITMLENRHEQWLAAEERRKKKLAKSEPIKPASKPVKKQAPKAAPAAPEKPNVGSTKQAEFW